MPGDDESIFEFEEEFDDEFDKFFDTQDDDNLDSISNLAPEVNPVITKKPNGYIKLNPIVNPVITKKPNGCIKLNPIGHSLLSPRTEEDALAPKLNPIYIEEDLTAQTHSGYLKVMADDDDLL